MKHILGKNTKSKITPLPDKDQIQPNQIDISMDAVFRIINSEFILSEDNSKTHRLKEKLEPNADGMFELKDNEVYDFISESTIEIKEGEAAWLKTRSTLNRNGISINSGLYDSGYSGVIGGVISIKGGDAKIQKGARVQQLIVQGQETLNLYDGSYGVGKEHDNLYAQ